MDYACINDIDIGDVILRNNEKYVCISANRCQDEYYSLIYIIKEKYKGHQLALDLKNDNEITILEAYDFEDEYIYITEKSKYKNCFTQFIIFNMKQKG